MYRKYRKQMGQLGYNGSVLLGFMLNWALTKTVFFFSIVTAGKLYQKNLLLFKILTVGGYMN